MMTQSPASRRTYLDRDCWSYSEGCHMMFGRARAKCVTCCPVPEEISSACRGLSALTLWRSTDRMGSLFLSAAAAFSIVPREVRRKKCRAASLAVCQKLSSSRPVPSYVSAG